MDYRKLLKNNPDFRRLWLGQVISEIGDWLNNIAVLAMTIQFAGNGNVGLAVSIYAVARHVPLFLFGPIAGVVADRMDRRRLMIAADLVRAILAPGFLLTAYIKPLPVIYVTGAFLFSISAFFNAAKRASIPNLTLGTEELLAANGLSASTTAATIAVGSALGGIVATLIGRDAVFILNSITFLFSAMLIRAIRSPTQSERIPEVRIDNVRRKSVIVAGLTRAVSDFRSGLGYVRRQPLLASIFAVGAGWGLGNGVARALYSLFGASFGLRAAGGLVARPADFGISTLFVAMGVGGVLGAPIARRFNSSGRTGLSLRLGRSLLMDGTGLFIFSLMPGLWSAAAVLIAREANFAIWWTAQQTIIMKSTEDRFAGRVFASFETLTTLMMAGSIVAAGLAADRIGPKSVAAAGGLIIMISGAWFLLRMRHHASQQMDQSKVDGFTLEG
jgi:MFS family permease